MRKQQWINVLRNIEKLKKLVCIFFFNKQSKKKSSEIFYNLA